MQISGNRQSRMLNSLIHLVVGAIVGLVAVCIAANPALAQPIQAFHASMSVQPAQFAPGQSGKLTIHVTVTQGFHIQSNKPLDSFLQATVVKPVASPGIIFGKVVYPKAVLIPAPPGVTSAGKLSIFDGVIEMTIPFRVTPAAVGGQRTIKASITAQGCNADSCVAPKTLRLAVRINVTAAAGKNQIVAPQAVNNAQVPTVPVAAALPAALSDLKLIESRPYSPSTVVHQKSLWQWMVIALLAGLIMNVMPCVLPVIPLKVLSLVQQAHGDARVAMRHGLVYSAGVLTLFWLLAGVVVGYRIYEHKTFVYGSQFQHPAVTLILALIVLIFALSLLGVWTLSPPQAVYKLDDARRQHGGYLSSFGMGLLATALTTPCSVPFLGGLLAWVLSLSAGGIVGFFTLLGIGMALPFLILASYPKLLRFVPRAGRWTDVFKQLIGLVMLGVTLYLLTTLPDLTYIKFGLLTALLVAIACWIWGQGPSVNSPFWLLWSVRGMAVVLTGAAVWGASLILFKGDDAPRGWRNFSVSAMDKALAAGHPVMVDFTARWCINCHYIKQTVLESAAAKAAYKRYGVVLLRADMTVTNPPVNLLLKKLGGYSIPFLAIFSPGSPYHPATLRDFYSVQSVVRDVQHAAG
ncbi:MAG: cytochrome c biogenesis protein CcdA [Phycisphaerae bacterium]